MSEPRERREEPASRPDTQRAREELCRRFAGSGSIARLSLLTAMLPGCSPECVEEAACELSEEGIAELDCLADGALCVYFPRR